MTDQVEKFYAQSLNERVTRATALTLPGGEPRHNFLLVGAGMIGREHIRVTQLLGLAKVSGIVDPHGPSVEAALALFANKADEQPVVYGSVSEALAAGGFDAILICSPNFTHFDIVQQVKASGLPLFVEKPMATTLADAAKLLELEKTYPACIQVGMQYRYKSQYSEAFREVKQLGSLGAVKTVSMSEYRPPFLDKVNQWNKFNKYSGGTLVEKCCHYFDLINLMAESKPQSVYASGGQAVNFRDFEHNGVASDIDDHAFVVVNYENGVRASFTLNMFCEELYEELIVGGEKGRLIAKEASSFKSDKSSSGHIKVEVEGHADYEFKDVTYPALIERSGHHGATFFEHEAFIARLEGKAADSATLMQGMWAMIVASAAQQSLAQQKLIEIDEFLVANKLNELVD